MLLLAVHRDRSIPGRCIYLHLKDRWNVKAARRDLAAVPLQYSRIIETLAGDVGALHPDQRWFPLVDG